MARYKVITQKDEQYKIFKKRERIHHIVDAVYVLLMVIGIAICGINQSNNLIVGWGFILMGVISIPVTVFYVHMIKNGWRPLRLYDNPDYQRYIDKKQKEKDLSEIKFLQIFMTVFCFSSP